MTPARMGSLILVFAMAIASGSHGGDAPPAQFAGQISECQRSLEWLRNYLPGLLEGAKQPPSMGSVDSVLITAEIQKEIDAWSAAMEAWQKADEKRADGLVKQAKQLGEKRVIWEKRLAWRSQQGASAPTEESFEQTSGWRPRKSLALAMEARRRLSEVYGRLAEATTPEADPQLLSKLEDEAFAARVEVEIAEMRMNWETEDGGWPMRDPVIWSPELIAAQNRLVENRTQQEARRRAMLAAQHEFDEGEHLRKVMIDERNRQAEIARSAKK